MKHPSIIIAACMLGLPAGIRAQQPALTNGASAAVSPDGKRIAFTSDRTGTSQIYTIGVDGSSEHQVTSSTGPKGSPAWTGGGEQLFYSVYGRDTSEIFLIEHGGAVRKLGAVRGRMLALAPDGKRIAFTAGDWKANAVVTADIDGAHARQIRDSSSIAWNLRWSPDGKQIAFTGRAVEGKDLAVFVMNADGSGRHQVTHIPAERGNAQLPAWSPDGRQLAVQVSDTMHTGGIWVVNIATGVARELAPHRPGYEDEIPAWFPDGKRIAFQSDRTGRMEIWVMNADGSGVQQVTGRP